MELKFVIEKIINNLAQGSLTWQEKGLESMAVSGPYGKGELPSGLYKITRNGLLDKPSENPYCDLKGNCWFQYIVPQFSTDRTELGIHPDGNLPGTLGCIGLLDSDTKPWYEAFLSLSHEQVVILEVFESYV